MYARAGSRLRSRGGSQFSRGRRFSLNQDYARSDFNKFAVLSNEHEQDGGLVFCPD